MAARELSAIEEKILDAAHEYAAAEAVLFGEPAVTADQVVRIINFYRRVYIFPGLTVNLSRSGPILSEG